MKKTIVLLVSLLIAAAMSAQSKKIAMLETLAVTEGVSSMVKSMVRGELTKSISVEKGYTAFTRLDVDKMASEMKFQSSGMVNDEQRVQLGMMSGADYICISKVSKDGESYYIEAQLVSVESGEIVNPATNFVSSGGMSAVNKACRILGRELIYGPGTGGDIKLSAAEIRQEKEEKVKAAAAEKKKQEEAEKKAAFNARYKMPKTVYHEDVAYRIISCKRRGSDVLIDFDVKNTGRAASYFTGSHTTPGDAPTLYSPQGDAYMFSGGRCGSSRWLYSISGTDIVGGQKMMGRWVFNNIPDNISYFTMLRFKTKTKGISYKWKGHVLRDIPIQDGDV